MNYDKYSSFFMDNERESNFWKKSIFVFDTSALLNFYSYSESARGDIFNKIFANLSGKLWIPGHVEYEFIKNREGVISKLIKDNYKSIERDYINEMEKNLNNINKEINNLQNRIKKSDAHPYLDDTIIASIREKYNGFKDGFNLFKESFADNIKEKINSIEELKNYDNDIIIKKFQESFDIGEEYGLQKIMNICKEGEERYRKKWPPGYEDESDKVGMQIYGDLIIWKQIIDYAKEKQNDIIFIIDDTKPDWCYTKKEHGEVRIIAPRDELVLEINKQAKVDIWMYSLSQFLYHAKEYVNDELSDETIEEVKSVKKELKYGLLLNDENKYAIKISEAYAIKKWLEGQQKELNYRANLSSGFFDIILEPMDPEGISTGVIVRKFDYDPSALLNKFAKNIDIINDEKNKVGLDNVIFICFTFEKSLSLSVSNAIKRRFLNNSITLIFGNIGKDMDFHKNL